eukprot:6608235-Pyramimonas_sp.AAC.1
MIPNPQHTLVLATTESYTVANFASSCRRPFEPKTLPAKLPLLLLLGIMRIPCLAVVMTSAAGQPLIRCMWMWQVTREYPEGREVVVVANDCTFKRVTAQAGTTTYPSNNKQQTIRV